MNSVFLKDSRFISINYNSTFSFGGNQSWFSSESPFDRRLSEVGCGVVSACDTLLYLSKQYPDHIGVSDFNLYGFYGIDFRYYEKFIKKFAWKYANPVPVLGMTGFRLSFGLNRYFRKNSVPLKARWKFAVLNRNIMQNIHSCLEKDIPVIMSIPPRPFFGKGLEMKGAGPSRSYDSHSGHFIVVTGMICRNEKPYLLELSSWGKRFTVDCKRFLSLSRIPPFGIFCGIMLINPI